LGDPGQFSESNQGASQIWCSAKRYLCLGFSSEGVIFQIGNSPRRIDIITSIDGVKFDRAYANKATIFLEGLEVPVISMADLITNKRASGRKQDLADVEKLESAANKR
jgi:hypothetical protein